MAFTVTFPVDTGTFVIVNHEGIDLTNPKNLRGRLGSIACYQCVTKRDEEDHIVMVSCYNDDWAGEYLLSKLLIATDKQVTSYEKMLGIK